MVEEQCFAKSGARTNMFEICGAKRLHPTPISLKSNFFLDER